MINVCKNCGIEFTHRAKRVFCSPECRAKYNSSKVEYIDFTCEWCGKPFKKLRRYVVSETNKGKTIRFCSEECRNAEHGKNRQVYQCAYCGKDFIKNPKQSGVCCSPECSELLRQQKNVTRTCKYCGKQFTRKKSHMDLNNSHSPGLYCSSECSNKAKIKLQTRTCTCKECGKTFQYRSSSKRAFCDDNCRKAWRKKQRVSLICAQCGKQFSVTKSRYDMYHSKYCSNNCRMDAIKITKDTYEKVSHALRTSQQYLKWREKVLSSHNNTCQECGNKDSIMHVHHVKELYKICQEYNFNIDDILMSDIFNDVDNGQCLCEKCHQNKHYQLRGETRNSKGQFCRLVSKELEDEMIRAELSGKAKPEKAC